MTDDGLVHTLAKSESSIINCPLRPGAPILKLLRRTAVMHHEIVC